MLVDLDAENQIAISLHQYCRLFDRADFDAFASLFDHGRWFMVDKPGSRPVREWIVRNVRLYDGYPLTRHEISNLVVDVGPEHNEATFGCYIAIWQHLPTEAPRLLTHARFDGTFTRVEDTWRWTKHAMTADWVGDLTTHIKNGMAADS